MARKIGGANPGTVIHPNDSHASEHDNQSSETVERAANLIPELSIFSWAPSKEDIDLVLGPPRVPPMPHS